MVDSAYIEMSWEKGTKVFSNLSKYRKLNAGVNGHGNLVMPRGEFDSSMLLLHKMSSAYGPFEIMGAEKIVHDGSTYILKSPEEKEKLVYFHKWRKDLEGSNFWLRHFHYPSEKNSGAGVLLLDDEIDGNNERATSYVWLGTEISWMRIHYKDKSEVIENRIPGTSLFDETVNDNDLNKIKSYIQDYIPNVNVKFRSKGTRSRKNLESMVNSVIKKAMPDTHKHVIGNRDNNGYFVPYSFIELSGKPLDVREAMFLVLGVCENEIHMHSRWTFPTIKKINDYKEIGLSVPVGSKNVIYKQKLVK